MLESGIGRPTTSVRIGRKAQNRTTVAHPPGKQPARRARQIETRKLDGADSP
jgi:hypothetical protein